MRAKVVRQKEEKRTGVHPVSFHYRIVGRSIKRPNNRRFLGQVAEDSDELSKDHGPEKLDVIDLA